MRVTINGNPTTLEAPQNINELLQSLDLAPIRVAVEINESIVSRKRFGETALRDGDRIEIVTFVGGG